MGSDFYRGLFMGIFLEIVRGGPERAPYTKDVMNKTSLKKLKAHYEEMRSEIIEALSKEDSELDLEGDEIDKIQGTTLHQMSEKLSIARKLNLAKLDEALAAISDGSINECEECGEPIGEKRLMAIPGVRMCIACAEEAEQNSKMFA